MITTIHGEPIGLAEPGVLTHLQFRRFAGCPVCNLHLRTFVRRHDELTKAGVREVVFFHSDPDELRKHAADLPFHVIADPDKRHYREFGVESSPWALLNPRVWFAIIRAIVTHRGPTPSLRPKGGRWGLPADFLLDGDGRVIASKHGEHAYDQWEVDEVLRLAKELSVDARLKAKQLGV